MIIDKIGDILHTEADVICHQVNCKGVMGAGSGDYETLFRQSSNSD